MIIIEIIKQNDPRYPKRLLNIPDPPTQLYVKGDANLLNKPSIAIVGSRNCTDYGYKQALKFSKGLSNKDICVISGMAIGIDTAAHQGAKTGKGKTIAVLGAGFDHIYPEQNIELYNQIIAEGGCVITEHQPEKEVDLSSFPRRNRIIAGISMGVLLIEGRVRSGSVVTAHHALKQKKEVFCIPHNLESTVGGGPNNLIKNGCNLVITVDDILEHYEFISETQEKEKVETEYDDIYKLISNVPININDICKQLKLNISEVNQKIFMLELQGLIKSLPGNEYVRV